jgi:hypothetical protein
LDMLLAIIYATKFGQIFQMCPKTISLRNLEIPPNKIK